MSDKEPKLLCYNRGCGQEFKESENRFDSCLFHPGTPFFHDAYKGWTCCRKCVDFQEFLNMKGCAKGYHTNVKPPEPEKKPVDEQLLNDEVIEVRRTKYVQKERPSLDAPLVPITTMLSEGLKQQTYGRQNREIDVDATVEIKVGVTPCFNNGCKKKYEGPETDTDPCKFHPGEPIFHEGLKFWSCCQKRTSDFEVFMNQEGCTTGSHVWVKSKNDTEGDGGTTLITCRHDWHQDGSFVHVAIYVGGKKFDPSKSYVKVNGVKLSVELFFPEEHSLYKETWILAGIIDPAQSSASMTQVKVEIKLRKAEPVRWTDLNIPEKALQCTRQAEKDSNEHKNVGVDPVDLSDL